ncbi:glycosyltransferase [Halostella sp. JP-L12]|uniref:glycosyltransferase family 4 protein n=1 Tax=Halostella TaxID=1843185 RepID=UPI000EF7C882|nr:MULTISPECIES: glycosyltransferase [Halostella]NHN48722.1 glycosyltransferase [Halostella sp. JP-L12]
MVRNARGAEDDPGVCVVTHPLSAAGENATRTLLEILAAVTSVSLVTADLPADSVIRDRHEVVEITRKGAGDNIAVAAGRFLLNQLRMCRTISSREEEIVLFFGATSYVLPVLAARLLGKTVVVEPRGDVPLTLRLNWEELVPSPVARTLAGGVRALERLNYRLADAIIAYTPSMAEQFDLDAYRHKLYPNGARYVDTDAFDVTVPYEERDRTVGFLGRIDEEKGVRELADVARRLPDDVTFRFIGDGDLSDWLERELATEIESGTVELAGWVDHDDVPSELNDLRLLVMPSQPTEGLPTTILESLACSTPVYATPVSGIPDVVRDGETGVLMTEQSPQEMAAEITQVLNEEDIAEMSENGRELIEDEYSFEAAVERYKAILDAIAQ